MDLSSFTDVPQSGTENSARETSSMLSVFQVNLISPRPKYVYKVSLMFFVLMSFFRCCLHSSWNSRRGDAGHPDSAPCFGLLCQKESTFSEGDKKQLFQHAIRAQCGKIPVRDNRPEEGTGGGLCLSLFGINCKFAL